VLPGWSAGAPGCPETGFSSGAGAPAGGVPIGGVGGMPVLTSPPGVPGGILEGVPPVFGGVAGSSILSPFY